MRPFCVEHRADTRIYKTCKVVPVWHDTVREQHAGTDLISNLHHIRVHTRLIQLLHTAFCKIIDRLAQPIHR